MRRAVLGGNTGAWARTPALHAVAATMPELPQVRASVEEVDRLRTTYITWGVTRWPVELKRLPGIFGDCL